MGNGATFTHCLCFRWDMGFHRHCTIVDVVQISNIHILVFCIQNFSKFCIFFMVTTPLVSRLILIPKIYHQVRNNHWVPWTALLRLKWSNQLLYGRLFWWRAIKWLKLKKKTAAMGWRCWQQEQVQISN